MKTILIALLAALQLSVANAQPDQASAGKPHKIVFEVVADGEEAWTAVLNNVENVRTALGADATKIEVVAHGKGLGLLMKDSPVRARLEKIAGPDVVFTACENTMKRKNVAKEALSPSVTTTDSGVAEVVRKQEAGWSYVKSGG
jgi:intracellular sulfur oxidation DsrE/DsrF family protein